jgi:hypothetical protein
MKPDMERHALILVAMKPGSCFNQKKSENTRPIWLIHNRPDTAFLSRFNWKHRDIRENLRCIKSQFITLPVP